MPNLTEIYMLDSAQHKYIANGAFKYNRALKLVKLNKTMETIGNEAFDEDTALETFEWNDSPVTRIGTQAFRANGALKMNSLPETVSFIGERAFLNASSITVSKLPDALHRVSAQCFMGCTNSSINTFPSRENACSISYAAFQNGGAGVNTIRIESPWILNDQGYGNGIARPFFGGYKSVTSVEVYSNFMREYTDDEGVLDVQAISEALFGEYRRNITYSIING